MRSQTEAVILAAKRTAIGTFRGTLSNISAAELGQQLAKQLIALTKVPIDDIDQTIVGCVLQAGIGLNIARQISVGTGVPVAAPAFTVNEACGSGLKALELAANDICLGNSRVVLAGGVESMSRAPFLINRTAMNSTDPDRSSTDHIQQDGLVDPFSTVPMGYTAEVVASEACISRADQDVYALESYDRYFRSRTRLADEIVPVVGPGPNGSVSFEIDESPRATSLDALAKLQPVFDRSGTITAGNASNYSDGAALAVIADRNWADAQRLPYKFVLRGFVTVGLEPMRMGLGPVEAIRSLWQKFSVSDDDIDLYEINEAFAGQVLAVIQTLNLPRARVNVNGGAVALGHPLGASGCRLIVTLTHEMARRGSKRGIAALCIGGGMGIAALVEAV
jgi:acetyl-CoA C-acetyltransferase